MARPQAEGVPAAWGDPRRAVSPVMISLKELPKKEMETDTALELMFDPTSELCGHMTSQIIKFGF